MNTVQVKDKQFALYIPEEEILARVKELANRMNTDLAGKNPLFLVVLNGSFVFAADLLRDITIPCEITFVRVASYEGVSSTGEVKQLLGLTQNIEGRTIIIIEDIIDTGLTMKELLRILKEKNPAEIHIASLLVKPDNLQVDLDIPYRCFDIANEFIVGYGLDYDHEGRNLRHIYQVVE
ncbi:MAG: hypoxanthine phosphoribosyltransferase [Bacteroidaceae bacterium]|nr:hypoxanthine phosphoribosyltransferase [Bacteroidaceae bacterium]MBQ8500967.1 hypoxanthine phosphoribosyltransferase [Bacteroides sp.]